MSITDLIETLTKARDDRDKEEYERLISIVRDIVSELNDKDSKMYLLFKDSTRQGKDHISVTLEDNVTHAWGEKVERWFIGTENRLFFDEKRVKRLNELLKPHMIKVSFIKLASILNVSITLLV